MQTFVPSKGSPWLSQGHKRFLAIRPTFSLFWGAEKRSAPLKAKIVALGSSKAITHAYKSSGCPLPLGVRCHSTRSISTSWAALKDVPLSDICAAATWSSTNTFSQYYRINVAASDTFETAVLSGPSTF